MLQFAQGKGNPALVLVDPTFGNLTQWDGIEIMKFFSSMPENHNQVRPFQPPEVFGHGLARHGEVLAQFAEGLPIAVVQSIEQLSPARIGQRFKNFIHCLDYATKWLHVNHPRNKRNLYGRPQADRS